MPATIVNLSGYSWGIEEAESGLNISQFDVTVRPEFKEFLNDRTNSKIGFAIGPSEEEISIAGEVSGALPIEDFASAVSLANEIDYADVSAGTIFFDEMSVTQARGAWKSFTGKLSRNSGIALAP